MLRKISSALFPQKNIFFTDPTPLVHIGDRSSRRVLMPAKNSHFWGGSPGYNGLASRGTWIEDNSQMCTAQSINETNPSAYYVNDTGR